MERPYRYINVDRKGDVFCVSLKTMHLDEPDVVEMGEEVIDLIENQGCRKMVLILAGKVDCLYSVFLAKLVMIRRVILENSGRLKIAEASLATIGVFAACQLDTLFEFVPDLASAIASLAE